MVDDDPTLRFAIASCFKRRGFETVEASGGTEAYAVVVARHIDVVVTDFRMPDGSGLELLELVRALPDGPPVIIITGFSEDGSLEEASRKGARAVLQKPYPRQELFDAVISALKR